MESIEKEIANINNNICKNIDQIDDSERGFMSQNILSQLRNLIDHSSLRIYSDTTAAEVCWDDLKKANKYVQTVGKLKFIYKFYKFLEIVASHYTQDEQGSERLMLKYYEYLLRLKKFLKENYNIDVLENLNRFPINTDPALQEYYEKIVEQINNPKTARKVSTYSDRYYIQKIKPFFVDGGIYYEVTFTVANSRVSKFDRVIAFTNIDLSSNYSVKLSVIHDSIDVLDKRMPIQIIDKWEVSIRPCEINNFGKIFGLDTKIKTGLLEYKNLMTYLTESDLNLSDIVKFDDEMYAEARAIITMNAEALHFVKALDTARELIKDSKPASNVLKYLLLHMNNRILKLQYCTSGCGEWLSNLSLWCGCIPFDRMPFNSSLIGHNPKTTDVFECIDFEGRDHELFAKMIRNNTETKGVLYTPENEIPNAENIPQLIETYNRNLYLPKHTHRKLEQYQSNVYINGYESDTVEVIRRLSDLSSGGIKNYANSVKSWMETTPYEVDCKDKKEVLQQVFENSKVAFIYGSAGTGKTTLIKHISSFFNDKKKFYLANTNPAVANLERRVSLQNCDFMTITKFLSIRNTDIACDVLFIDECSTVSNSDMLAILRKAEFKLLVLVGDIYQIESIVFGNWFSISKSIIKNEAKFELTVPWRTKSKELINLWNKVRNLDEDILEFIVRGGYSTRLDETIFENVKDNEIILCLNYDGLYGINNINRFLQSNNENPAVQWGIHTYKIGDPVLFNETNRFRPLIYNNLKGKIVGIEASEDQIIFNIQIDLVINEFAATGYDFELIDGDQDGTSVIRFVVNKYKNTDEDDDDSNDTLVPFQVAYAVSIHKAQGLEYASVKIVITTETEEMVTHNIFYTAITRAKEMLKIYWTPETENRILSGLKRIENGRDVAILKQKFKL
jgi:DNA replication protein DnaC